jgi:hypothetical protein
MGLTSVGDTVGFDPFLISFVMTVEPLVKEIDGIGFELSEVFGTDLEELTFKSREVVLTTVLEGNGSDVELLEFPGGVRKTVTNVVVIVLEVSYHPICERTSLPTTPAAGSVTSAAKDVWQIDTSKMRVTAVVVQYMLFFWVGVGWREQSE